MDQPNRPQHQPHQAPILVYDGDCGFCRNQVATLQHLIGSELHYESFHDPKVLAKFPGLTLEECMKEIKLATPEGQMFGGAHAIFYALSLNPFFRPLRWIYPVPGLKQIFDWGYQFVAINRYKIPSRTCPTGTCQIHSHAEGNQGQVKKEESKNTESPLP